MALDPGTMHKRIIENLSDKTGHALTYWLSVLDSLANDKRARIAHLKDVHGIGHHTAVAIVREKMGDVPWTTPESLEASLRAQIAPDYITLYDTLRDDLTAMDGVTMVPCKTYTGFKAKRQFAVLKPSKADGLHIGMALPCHTDSCLTIAKNIGSERISAKAIAADGVDKIKALLIQAARMDQD